MASTPIQAQPRTKCATRFCSCHEFISLLPPAETPAHTEGYEGFYHINEIGGDETTAHLHMLIRDHSDEVFEKRKAFVKEAADYLNRKYGENTFDLTVSDSYRNMRVIIDKHPETVQRAKNAMLACRRYARNYRYSRRHGRCKAQL